VKSDPIFSSDSFFIDYLESCVENIIYRGINGLLEPHFPAVVAITRHPQSTGTLYYTISRRLQKLADDPRVN
jgi:hypothetical protein